MNTFIRPLSAWSFLRLASLSLAVSITACGDDDPSGDAGPDAAVSDGAVTGDAMVDAGGGEAPFGPCASDADCPDGTFCDREMMSSIEVPGAPNGRVEQALFPGGSCSPRPLAPADSMAACDSSLPQAAQGCGADGACVLESLNMETYAGCRPACSPSATRSGCERSGYTCDFGLKACVEGCRSDAECRITTRDNNGDGIADSLAYDTESRAVCDANTARCSHSGNDRVPVGSSCERLDDCSPGSVCLSGVDALAGLDFPDGYCSAVGCDVEGRECEGSGSVCEALRPWLSSSTNAPLCMQRCEVGAEAEDLQTGSTGHGEGCREGYRCHYNGGMGAGSGVCVGGNYNDVTNNNIGAACDNDSQCYSPYGYGRCLLYTATEARIRAPRGTCTVLDCAAPGLPDDICGTGNECIPFASDITFCIHNCSTALDCPQGYACMDEDDEPATQRICFPACAGNNDCRPSERCQVAQGQMYGRCVASGASSG